MQSLSDDFYATLITQLNQLLPAYWLVAALLAGGVIALIFSVTLRNKLGSLTTERDQLALDRAANTQKIESLEETNNLINTKANEQSAQINRLFADAAGDKAHLQAGREKLADLKVEFDRQKSELKNEFKAVSEHIIKERQEALAAQNKEGVGALLKPLQDQIAGFQKRVNEVHDVSIKDSSTLKAEIANVISMGVQMREEANNLASALQGNSQQRGAWGEAQLERTLELSGLVAEDHFEKQSSFVDEDGRRKQTDFLIKLPGEKCIIIDSKVSLNAYERAANAELEHQGVLMQAHVAAVRSHIVDLTAKDYTNLPGVHSPDFILMFMPIEPAYIEAMKYDPELFGYGQQQNVILVSHTTLIPILRTVANLWMLDRSNKEARLIGDKANDIYNSVATVSQRLESLGKSLATAGNHYNSAVTAVTGNQGLQGKVSRFTELSAKASKDMPELEHQHLEFDTAKLESLPLNEDDDTDEK